MKIAVVGCGAVGSFYGAKLCHSGQEVHFLLRSDYEAVRRKGVMIRSVWGDFHVQPRCARDPDEIGVSDLVLIGLKTTANHQYSRLLSPLVGPKTAVLSLQNGLGNEEQLACCFPFEQIMGGLCFVCLNRLEPGLIHHLDHGRVVLGEFKRLPLPRTETIATLFRASGVPCEVTDDLARTHWEKLVWNIPFNGLGVAAVAGYDAVRDGLVAGARVSGPCLPADHLLADQRWETLVRELMGEVVAAACALGFKIPYGAIDLQIERTRTMGAYRASTLLDFERGLPLELESLFFEPLRQAKQVGVKMPCLENLAAMLQHLEGLQSRAFCTPAATSGSPRS